MPNSVLDALEQQRRKRMLRESLKNRVGTINLVVSRISEG